MKKLLLLSVIAVFAIGNVNAQEGFKLGASVGYLSDIGTLGFGADAVYGLNEDIELALNFTYAKEEPITFTIIDLNGHYMFDDNFYGLAGLEFLNSKFDVPVILGFGGGSVSDTSVGLNLGGGYRYELSDSISLFSEAKYVILEGSYFHIRAGVLFNL